MNVYFFDPSFIIQKFHPKIRIKGYESYWDNFYLNSLPAYNKDEVIFKNLKMNKLITFFFEDDDEMNEAINCSIDINNSYKEIINSDIQKLKIPHKTIRKKKIKLSSLMKNAFFFQHVR